MTDPDELGRWLHTHRRALLDTEGTAPHPPDERWAEVAEGGLALSAAERAHLAGCAECRAVLAETARLVARPAPAARPRRVWLSAALGLAAAAAAGAFLLLRPPPTPGPDAGTFTARGTDDAAPADVALLATDADGRRRDVADGAHLRPTDRLGVVYGNPAGAHRTLVILGRGADRTHWYYPEGPGQPAQPITSGQAARGVRLPFDVQLDDHPPGPLRIVAAFDADPAAVAAALAAGGPVPGARVLEWRVQMEAK
ncbi:MAG: hypothetical protein R3F43_24805 [bacterium]